MPTSIYRKEVYFKSIDIVINDVKIGKAYFLCWNNMLYPKEHK